MNAYQSGQKLLCGDYFAYTPDGVSNFDRVGRYTQNGADVRKGDIGFFYYASLGRVGHVYAAYVVENDTAKKKIKIITVEGNSGSNTYERNGGMVCSKTHTISYSDIGNRKTFHGFGHPVYSDDTCTIDEFVDVLKGELGYIEKATNNQLGAVDRAATDTEKVANRGTNNFTKYGKWYHNGSLNGCAWCAMFISWCAYIACDNHAKKKCVKSGWNYSLGVWMYYENGKPVRDEWRYINGRWYVFDGTGDMITGWFKGGGCWYYLADDGGMLSDQWLRYDDNDFYLTSSGAMATNAYIRAEKVNNNGKYTYYYVDHKGEYVPEKDTESPDDSIDVIY